MRSRRKVSLLLLKMIRVSLKKNFFKEYPCFLSQEGIFTVQIPNTGSTDVSKGVKNARLFDDELCPGNRASRTAQTPTRSNSGQTEGRIQDHKGTWKLYLKRK